MYKFTCIFILIIKKNYEVWSSSTNFSKKRNVKNENKLNKLEMLSNKLSSSCRCMMPPQSCPIQRRCKLRCPALFS